MAERLTLAHNVEVEHLRLKLNDVKVQVEMINSEKETIESENKSQRRLINSLREDVQKLQSAVAAQKSDNEQLKIALSESEQEKREWREREQEMAASLTRKESEVSFKETALAQKDATISRLSEQLTRATEYLSSSPRPQIPAKISWRECSQLPFLPGVGQTTVIDNKVYFGGFGSNEGENESIICCYNISRDEWNTLLRLPVRYFGLGQVEGELVAIGGERLSDGKETNEVNVFDERRKRWKPETLPPMKTARHSPTVITHSTVLIVAGGWGPSGNVDTVELYKTDTSQWYVTDPLPTPCRVLSQAVVQDTCYLVGGYSAPSHLNQVVCASIGQLVNHATLHNGGSPDGRVGTQDHASAWKELANTPTYQPTAAVMLGTVLAIGGCDSYCVNVATKNAQSALYMYSPSTNSWIHVDNLPAPRWGAAAVALSPTEIMVIGGWHQGRVNTVYNGTLSIAFN